MNPMWTQKLYHAQYASEHNCILQYQLVKQIDINLQGFYKAKILYKAYAKMSTNSQLCSTQRI